MSLDPYVPLAFIVLGALVAIDRLRSRGGRAGGSDPALLQRVAKLEREVQALRAAVGGNLGEAATGSGEHTALAAEARLIRQTKGVIPAIKHVREQTGWGLKEAKEYVEGL